MNARTLFILSIVAVALALPASAAASTYTVNETGDQPDPVADNLCDHDTDTMGSQCTLRAAIEEANSHSGADTIRFSSLFNGNAANSTIDPDSGLPAMEGSTTLDGGNCASSGTAKPCVEIDATGLTSGLQAFGPRVDIRGVAITNASTDGINMQPDTSGSIKGSWLGVSLDGTLQGNSVSGASLDGTGSTVIGGTTGADRNVIGGNGSGVTVRNDDNRIRGNYFGVLADGVTAAANNPAIDFPEFSADADNNVVGASIDSAHRATAKCDGGCNVIANSTGDGIFLKGATSSGNVLKGNFIGLDATGLTAAENSNQGITVGAPDTTIGGDTSAERNFVTGGSLGINASADGLDVKRNWIGLNLTGTSATEPPTDDAIAVTSAGADPALISRNRIAGASARGITVEGSDARVIRNKIGLATDGSGLPGPSSQGILVRASDSTIGEPGAGNTVANMGANTAGIFIQGNTSNGGGDANKVQGNFVGTDSGGANWSNGGWGIQVESSSGPATDNRIGGTSAATENVVSNNNFDAIRLVGSTSTGNEIKRNRGKDNGAGEGATGLFIELLGPEGFGNTGGPNDAIGAPAITNVDPGDVTRTHIEGTGANPGATIYIFRTSSAAGASPPRINGFVDTAVANGSGDWSANFPQIPSGQNLTALQLDATDGSSELAAVVAP